MFQYYHWKYYTFYFFADFLWFYFGSTSGYQIYSRKSTIDDMGLRWSQAYKRKPHNFSNQFLSL